MVEQIALRSYDWAMKWSSAIATSDNLSDAISEAAETALSDLASEKADLVFVFVSEHYASYFATIPNAIEDVFSSVTLFGCSAAGVIGDGVEVEDQPAVAVMAASLPDVRLTPMYFGADPRAWGRQARTVGENNKLTDMIVLSDTFTGEGSALIEFLDGAFPEATKVGGLVGANGPGETVLYGAGEVHRSGTVVLGLEGNLEMVTAVAQGCRPIGSPMFVTRYKGPLILELDGKPALRALDGMFAALPAGDRENARSRLVIGVAMTATNEVYEQGDFLIRDLGGVDPDSGAIAIAGTLAPNQVIQFHLRDAETSAEDIDEVISRHLYADACGALLFTCRGRGQRFYGAPNRDSNALKASLGPLALGGLFANGEIGPVVGKTFIHTYTSAFSLFRPKHSN